MLIDTHAHLAHPLLLNNIEQVVQQAVRAGLTGILCVATNLEESQLCLELAEKYDLIRASIGIHPNECCRANDGDWERIAALSQHPAAVALGETGLDRYWDDCPWELQLDYFRRHIELSRQSDLPVIIHMRDCPLEMAKFLKGESERGPFKGVMHSFTGPPELASVGLELGLYISFAGMITFKNSTGLRSVAATIPGDRLLVETDSPYLTPHPYRGQRPNRPDLVRHTLECLAELHQRTAEELAEKTTQNALKLFHRWRC